MKSDEKVIEEFDEICYYNEELSMFETPNYNPDKPVYRKVINAEHLGDAEKLLVQVKSFLLKTRREAVEEAFKEIDIEERDEEDCDCEYRHGRGCYVCSYNQAIDKINSKKQEFLMEK